MSINIACVVPGCTNPVIGQCVGYKQSCGRYYCREHSSDTLCAICANNKQVDDQAQAVYKDYLATAEGLEREARAAINTKAIFGKGAKIVAIAGFFGGPIVMLANEGGVSSIMGFLIGPLAALYFYTILLGPVIWGVCGIMRGDWHREKGLNRATDIDKLKPGFLEFYTTWRKEKSKEKLMTALTIAGVVAAVGIGAALSDSEDSRVRRAVNNELTRHGL